MRVTGELLTNAQWRTSSYSNAAGGDCVEVATHALDDTVPVRDSKRRATPALLFSRTAWTAFLEAVKQTGGPHP